MTDGTYYYSLFARYSDGTYSDPVTTSAIVNLSVPGVVTFLTAESEGDTVTLNWTNPLDSDFDSVMIRVSTTSYPLSTSDGSLVSGDVLGTTYEDSSLADDTYYYAVFAKDTGDNYSSVTTVSVVVDTTAPSQIADLSATSNESQVDFTWENPSDLDFDSVMIRRSTVSAPNSVDEGDLVASDVTATSYSDTSLADATYYYSFFCSRYRW